MFLAKRSQLSEASSPERTPGRSPEGHVAFLVQEAASNQEMVKINVFWVQNRGKSNVFN
jgi:hypothetical protein